MTRERGGCDRAVEAAVERAISEPQTRVAGLEKPNSVVTGSPAASDVVDAGRYRTYYEKYKPRS